MKLVIKQDISKKRSYEHEIFEGNKKLYHGKFSSRNEWVMKKLNIYDHENKLIYIIKQDNKISLKNIFKSINPFYKERVPYDIHYLGEKVGHIVRSSKNGGHIRAKINDVNYEAWNLYNTYISIYKEEKQIAMIRKEAMDWYDSDIYYISSDDDVSKEIIIVLNLIYDIEFFTFAHHKERHYIVKAFLSPRKFDKDWKPNQNKEL